MRQGSWLRVGAGSLEGYGQTSVSALAPAEDAFLRNQSPLRITPPLAETITARSNCATFVPSTVRASQRFAM